MPAASVPAWRREADATRGGRRAAGVVVVAAQTRQIAHPDARNRGINHLVALVILDGWGCAPPGPGNAVELAHTPNFDRLWREFPHTTLDASGEAVGLPAGQMGNSEVGHLTIGSGRRLYQDLMRVNKAIEDGSFFENRALRDAFERGTNVHLLGLVSYGGVHSHIDHVRALLTFAPEKTWIHAFTDGRDVSPTSARKDLAELPQNRIASVVGRYYAMDRDQRWDRTNRAFAAICLGQGDAADDPIEAVRSSYERGVTDEFIEPVIIRNRPRLRPEDAAIFFNFRPDRARQLSRLLVDEGYDLTTMTRYSAELPCPVAFEEQVVQETLAEILAERGVRQLHVAETEKYAHVTYFFNGGREAEWEGETRILVPSPRDVPSYDHKPEMSAREVTERFCAEVGRGYGFAIVNFANPDMVGHTGSIPAVTRAVETTDECLGRVVDAVDAAGGVCLITADHGNAEQMLEPDGVSPHTAHTTNPVPLIVTDRGVSLAEDGELADLVPTVLKLLGLTKSSQMTGRELL
jgi:2,3-bisphosphoglycerate-independent phosphoglycerate mutase